MRILTYLLSVIALVIVLYNLTRIDFSEPFENESYTAILTSLAGGCSILLLTIIRVVKKIDKRVKEKS
tara:strand:+ start:647 stop:850 length:204 start_codon:yes stop_codon:yes gene_type:complete